MDLQNENHFGDKHIFNRLRAFRPASLTRQHCNTVVLYFFGLPFVGYMIVIDGCLLFAAKSDMSAKSDKLDKLDTWDKLDKPTTLDKLDQLVKLDKSDKLDTSSSVCWISPIS